MGIPMVLDSLVLRQASKSPESTLSGILDITGENVQGVIDYHKKEALKYYEAFRRYPIDWDRFGDELIEQGISPSQEYSELVIKGLLQYLSTCHNQTLPVPRVIDDTYHFLIVNEAIWHDMQYRVLGNRMEHIPIASYEYSSNKEMNTCTGITVSEKEMNTFIKSIFGDTTSEVFSYDTRFILYLEARLSALKAQRILNTLESMKSPS